MQNINEVYQEYSKLVFKYLFCISHNSEIAEDLMQETFLCAFNNINKFRGDCKISTWLCQIAKHLWYKELKRSKKFDLVQINDIKEHLGDINNIEDILLENETKQEIYSKIQMLQDPMRQVVSLRIIGDLNFSQIGEIFGKSDTWARVTYYRGKEKIKGGNYDEKSWL